MIKKLKKTILENMFHDKAYKLVFGSISREMESEIEKTKHKAEEIERGVKKTEESIARGARRTKHRFRI